MFLHVFKPILFVLNFILMAMGLGFIGLGVFLHIKFEAWTNVKPEEAYGIMGIEGFGALITLTAFLGCCGVIHSKPAMLKGFCVLIAVLLLAQIGGGITVWQLG